MQQTLSTARAGVARQGKPPFASRQLLWGVCSLLGTGVPRHAFTTQASDTFPGGKRPSGEDWRWVEGAADEDQTWNGDQRRKTVAIESIVDLIFPSL